MAATPIDVQGRIDRPLLVSVIDATANAHGFEHTTTRAIVGALRAANVPVAGGAAQFVTDVAQLSSIAAIESTAVLFFGHGSPPVSDASTPTRISIGTIAEYWQLLSDSGLDWSDKLIVLCVCWGLNEDAVRAVCESPVGALAVVAPIDSLTAAEAQAFFPQLLTHHWQRSPTHIDPEFVRSLVGELNALASGKMRVYAAGESPAHSIFGK